MHKMIKIQEVADLLGVCKNTVHNIYRNDESFPRKVRVSARRVVFRQDEILTWLEGR